MIAKESARAFFLLTLLKEHSIEHSHKKFNMSAMYDSLK